MTERRGQLGQDNQGRETVARQLGHDSWVPTAGTVGTGQPRQPGRNICDRTSRKDPGKDRNAGTGKPRQVSINRSA
jgi:hypothetical protein